MVQLPAIRAANAAYLNSYKDSFTALFIGATTGIGENSVRALAAVYESSQSKNLRVYIVGRNESAAAKIISDCSSICPGGHFEFIKGGNFSLLRDVDTACQEVTRVIKAGSGNIDFLCMSQGVVSFTGRIDTVEGLDQSMSLLYYSRIRFILNLMPLLLASQQPAHILSVYAAGMEAKLIRNDLSLSKPENYTFGNCRSHCVHMKTHVFERLAAQHKGKLALVHAFPGLVVVPNFYSDDLPLWFKVARGILGGPVKALFSIPLEENGQRMLYCATEHFAAQTAATEAIDVAVGSNGEVGSGAYAVTYKSEGTKSKADRSDGFAEEVWRHTMEVFETIAKGKVFSG